MYKSSSLYFIVLFVVVVSIVDAVKPVVILPTKNSTTEAALVIVPAGKITGLAYRPLAEVIQQVSNVRLWIVLLTDFLAGFPNPAELPIGVDEAISALKKQGMRSDKIFLAGHSLGGENVAPYGAKHGKKLAGVLLYGAFLSKLDPPLSQYPVPVLHLSGDLDGRMRITRIADTFEELQQRVSQNGSAIYRTPVVVMRGVNHAQFASGPIPSKMTFYDLKPEVSSAMAYRLIANQTAAFIETSLSVTGEDLINARKILNDSFTETKAVMEPLLRLKAYDVNQNNSDLWGVDAQFEMARLPNSSLRVTNQILSNEKDFVTSKPTIDVTGQASTPLVRTFSHVRYVPNPGDLPTFTHSPMYVAVKMKSYAAIQNATNLKPGTSTNITCKDINEAAFRVANIMASDLAKQRYQSRGRKINFLEDWDTKTQLEWSASQINLYEDDVSLNVTSPFLWTSLNETQFPGFTGMHYCKLLVPYRAAEWIYVDSLRTHPIE